MSHLEDNSYDAVIFSYYRAAAKGFDTVFSSPEPKAHGELIVYQWSRRPSVRASVRPCVCASMRSHFQTLISQRPVDRLEPNFI